MEDRFLLSHGGGHEKSWLPTTPPPIIAPSPDPAIPLPDLKGTYQGLDGGLYGGGSNTPPASQAALGDLAAQNVQPLDAAGHPSPNGKVGMVAIGQSTTRIIFDPFQRMVQDLPSKSPNLKVVNAAQDGMVLQSWSHMSGPWAVAQKDVRDAGLTNKQVQVVWLEVAEIRSWVYGDLNARINQTVTDLSRVVRRVKQEFPNVRMIFLTSRPYGGYGPTGPDPEPYAYQSGFSVRAAIQQQIGGDPSLNADPSKGKVVAPVMLWGPYDWANGTTPSSSGLAWLPTDFSDGVHPNLAGSVKAANLLLQFFTTDPRATPWFLSSTRA